LLDGLELKSHLVYNGLDLENLLSREEARKRLELNLDDYIYGSIGRLAYPKNYEFLINSYLAVKALKPKAKLLLIGEGPERDKYENLIKLYQLEKEIILTGEIIDASCYLKAFDLFVLPSVFEGLSLSLIAAVQAGVPALASRVGGNEEVIGVSNCFKLDDKEDFLRLIKQNSFGVEQRTDFSADKMVSAYKAIYSI